MFAFFLMLAAQDSSAAVPTATPPPAVPVGIRNDREACETLNKVVASMQPELPKMVDAITRTDGISVICAARTYTTNKTLLADISAMREGWQGRKQAQLDQMTCADEYFGPLARRGWRIVVNFTFLSGERVTMVAKC